MFGPDTGAYPPIDVGDGFLMRHGYTVVFVRLAVRRAELPACSGSTRRRAARRRPCASRAVYVNLQAPEPVPLPALRPRHLAHPPRSSTIPTPCCSCAISSTASPDDCPLGVAIRRVAEGRVVPDPLRLAAGRLREGRSIRCLHRGRRPGAGPELGGAARLRRLAQARHQHPRRRRAASGRAYAARRPAASCARSLLLDLNLDEQAARRSAASSPTSPAAFGSNSTSGSARTRRPAPDDGPRVPLDRRRDDRHRDKSVQALHTAHRRARAGSRPSTRTPPPIPLAAMPR